MPLYVTNTSGDKIATFALLDGGANRHVVSEAICADLGIEGRDVNMKITTLDKTVEGVRKVADVSVVGTNGFELDLKNAIFGEIIATEGDRPPENVDVENMDHLSDIDFPAFPENIAGGKKIGVIIGAEHARIWSTGERRVGDASLPVALETGFGFCLIGPKKNIDSHCFVCNHVSFQSCPTDTEKDMKKCFASEFERIKGDDETMSLKDKHAVRQLEEGIIWDPLAERYRAPLPHVVSREATAAKINKVDSGGMALDRLWRTGRQMRKDPERRRITFETMAKFDEKGRVVEVDPAEHEATPTDRPKWTIPIHVTDKPGKPGQVRICHDCRASVGGICLNDFLLDGPQLACDIRGVLMRFRDEGEVAVGADIKDFFHEVYIAKEDEAAFRYWWFKSEDMDEVQLKGFLGHVFGAKSSNFVAIFTKRFHVNNKAAEYGALVVQAANRNFYVDDLLKSLRNTKIAKEFRINMTAAMKDGGFTLCKWRSSKPEVLDGMEAAPAEKDFRGPAADADDIGKLLGMQYSFSADAFFYIPDQEKQNLKVETKRQMLQVIASFFDPLGFLDPFVIWARLILQKVMKLPIGWDEKTIETNLLDEFARWQSDFVYLNGFKICRWTATLATQDAKRQLMVFSDASSEGYGVVIYVRRATPDGVIHVSIVCSKAHVVPVKDAEAGHHDSIPRLELQAARLAARMRVNVEKETGSYDNVVMWTDSECVIKQLHDTESRFKVYFSNRLSEIQALTSVDEWRWVPSGDNPADDCSHGLLASDPKWARFLNGPDFLREREEDWPSKQIATEPFPAHILATTVTTPEVTQCSWVTKMSSSVAAWKTKVRRIAWVKKTLL